MTRHKRSDLAADLEIMTKEAFTYSPQDSLLTQTHQINGGTIEVIANNTYDELGQLTSKKVGGNTQNINYTYNIRGWLTGINDVAALSKAGDPKDLFAFKINYNNTPAITGGKALYNGNIAETFWSSTSDATPIVRGYAYLYDNLNRLKTSFYKRDAVISNAYSENLTYDKNGNINSIIRNGNSETATQIDALVYTYAGTNTTNQLVKVVDNAPAASKVFGFTDSPANVVDDYSYDANGNMTKDNNKNITAITYNHLNLPTKITFATTGNIVYIYNAAGQKVQKIVNEIGKSVVTTDYLGGYQYDNGLLKFFPTAEGYVEPSGSSYKYVYQYKDHLGNVRLSYDKTLVIKEESNFYPFGLKQEGYNTLKIGVENKYKYNGKELQDEIGLNMYDMDMRQYDPAIGRWVVHDPIVHHSQSSYSAFNGNPIYWADPSGMAGEHYNWNTGGYENGSGQSISFSEAMGSYGLNTDGSKKNNTNENNVTESSETAKINPKEAFEYQKKYPRTMQVLRKLQGYVKSNPKILDLLSHYSGYSTMEVLSLLKYSENTTTLTIEDLTYDPRVPDGITNSASDFSLEIVDAQHFETLKKNEEIQSYSFYIAITILHEFVHAGRLANKMDVGGEEINEKGTSWELHTFKYPVSPYTVDKYKLHKKFNWNFTNYTYQLPPLF